MTTTTENAYLTVPEVAETLGISTDGVYKLIRREKLPALRLSERGVRVTRWALEAYREALNGRPDTSLPDDTFDYEEQLSAFEDQSGMSPDDWVAAWKSDSIADSPENNARLMQALALRGQREPVSHDWIASELAEHSAPETARTGRAMLWAINGYLQGCLYDRDRHEVPAVEAACWLDDAGLLTDSESRPGLPLRNLLRAGQIMGADQRPARRNGRWYITRAQPRTRAPRPR
jgi:excisionase family DNA binding protein